MKKLHGIILFILYSGLLIAQPTRPPFWDDIQAFKKQDSIHFPAAKQILFVGSSSFTMWRNLQEYFPDFPLLNRGFGGSSLSDLVYYSKDVITRYHPKQIVIYCGENDFAASDTVTVESVVKRFKELFSRIRASDRTVFISYVSMKPSPSRKHLLTKFVSANKEIELFLKEQRRTSFILVFDKMLNTDGTMRDDLYLEDGLHMNAKGYAIWQKEIEPHLLK